MRRTGAATATLPAPIRRVVDTGLRIAVRRWPAHLRDDMAAEWAAELHTITHDPDATTVQRCWRSLRYSTSLACARGIDTDTRGKAAVTAVWKPAAALLSAPLICAIAVFLGLASGIAATGRIVPDTFGPNLAATGLILVISTVVAYGVAVWLGRHAALRLGYASLPGPIATMTAAAATVALLGVTTALSGSPRPFGEGLRPAVIGVAAWALVAVVASTTTGVIRHRRPALAGVLLVFGSLLAADLGVTGYLLSHGAMAEAPLGPIALWYPSSLWTGEFPASWMGEVGDGFNVGFVIADAAIGYSQLLTALSAFLLGYLWALHKHHHEPATTESP